MVSKLKEYADLLATVSVMALAVVMIWALVTGRARLPGESGRSKAQAVAAPKRVEPPLPKTPVPIDPTKTIGSGNAKVALVIFSDFECPFCAVFSRDTLPTLMTSYVKSGKLQLSFRNFPLTNIHKFAAKAALAGECAARNGKFWDLHDQIFSAPRGRLGDQDLAGYAAAAGLDRLTFEQCLRSATPVSLAADVALGQELGVSGTPTFFVGRLSARGVTVATRLTGVRSPDEFSRAIESLLPGIQP